MSAKKEALKDIKKELDIEFQDYKTNCKRVGQEVDEPYKLRMSHVLNHKEYFAPVGELIIPKQK
tara:strand:+ start:1628 stop:1819 length:192 start_codon:yes stop_codon:yes gene_type:complete